MSPIVSAVDIACPPGEVFAYVTDPSRFGEWQAGVVSGHTDGEPAVGARFTTTRRIGGADRTGTSEITEINPPESWAIRGIDGPIRAAMQVSVEPRQNGEQSHVTFSLDLAGHGFGKLILSRVVSQARTEVPPEPPEAQAKAARDQLSPTRSLDALGQALAEPVEGVLGDLRPAVVDRERVAAIAEVPEVRHRR